MVDSQMVIAILALVLNDRAGNNICTVQRTEAKESENSFLWLSCDSPWAFSRIRLFLKGDIYLLNELTYRLDTKLKKREKIFSLKQRICCDWVYQ